MVMQFQLKGEIKNGISPSSVILVATIEQVEKQTSLKIEGRL
jgi:hypothetical protein